MQPPPSGLAVPAAADNLALVQDREALLGLKDALAGDATLNWSVYVTMADWDGVTLLRDPLRVEGGQEADRHHPCGAHKAHGLGGAAAVGEMGCIPLALRSVATNDLDDLGLPDCAG